MLGETTEEDVMSEQNKDLVRRYYDQVLNGGDLDAVGDCFADERVAGWVRKGCFFYFQAFPDLHVALDEFVAERPCLPPLDNDRHSRWRVQRHSRNRAPHRRRFSRGLQNRRWQVRRLLVHGECRGLDAPAH
jgi:hypothetical protein